MGNKTISSSQRIEWIDTLRTIAVLAVTQIHLCTPVYKIYFLIANFNWWIGNIMDSGLRFAVPLFVMISGATMLNKNYESYGDFMKRRFLRVFLPFIFWWFAYLPFAWLTIHPAPHASNFYDVIKWVGALFMEKGISMHFWYVYMLIFLYPLMPILSKFVRKISTRTLNIIIIAWILLNLFFNGYLHENIHNIILGKAIMYFRYIGYILLGYSMSKYKYGNKSHITALCIYLIITALIAYFSTAKWGATVKFQPYYGYLQPSTIIQSMCIFAIFANTKTKYNWLKKAINTISDYSYGIYLVHIMVIGILWVNGIYWVFINPILSLPLFEIIVIASSMTIIFLLRKIPIIGKHIAG